MKEVETLVEEQLMSYKVTNNADGEFEIAVKVHQFAEDADGNLYPNGTVNTWSLGGSREEIDSMMIDYEGDNPIQARLSLEQKAQEIAKSKVKTIIDTYLNGLEFVQSEVRRVFEEETS